VYLRVLSNDHPAHEIDLGTDMIPIATMRSAFQENSKSAVSSVSPLLLAFSRRGKNRCDGHQ
jgi:hypothetical protein